MNCENCNKEIVSKFSVGEVVSHKTNGFKMIIIKVADQKGYHPDPLPGYECKYQNPDGYFRRDYFQEFELGQAEV